MTQDDDLVESVVPSPRNDRSRLDSARAELARAKADMERAKAQAAERQQSLEAEDVVLDAASPPQREPSQLQPAETTPEDTLQILEAGEPAQTIATDGASLIGAEERVEDVSPTEVAAATPENTPASEADDVKTDDLKIGELISASGPISVEELFAETTASSASALDAKPQQDPVGADLRSGDAKPLPSPFAEPFATSASANPTSPKPPSAETMQSLEAAEQVSSSSPRIHAAILLTAATVIGAAGAWGWLAVQNQSPDAPTQEGGVTLAASAVPSDPRATDSGVDAEAPETVVVAQADTAAELSDAPVSEVPVSDASVRAAPAGDAPTVDVSVIPAVEETAAPASEPVPVNAVDPGSAADLGNGSVETQVVEPASTEDAPQDLAAVFDAAASELGAGEAAAALPEAIQEVAATVPEAIQPADASQLLLGGEQTEAAADLDTLTALEEESVETPEALSVPTDAPPLDSAQAIQTTENAPVSEAPTNALPTDLAPATDALLAVDASPVEPAAIDTPDVSPPEDALLTEIADNTPVLEGPLVLEAQRLLTEMGYGPGVLSGRVGAFTRIAARDFGIEAGVEETEITPAFVARLQAEIDAGRLALESRNNPGLAQVNRVRLAQRHLNTLGYDAGPEDGDAGSRTIAAAAAFASDTGASFTQGFTADFIRALQASISQDGAQAELSLEEPVLEAVSTIEPNDEPLVTPAADGATSDAGIGATPSDVETNALANSVNAEEVSDEIAAPAPEEGAGETPGTDIQAMSEEEIVRGIQEYLAQLGYEPGEADGVIGGRTEAAAAAFAVDRDLEALRLDGSFLALLRQVSNEQNQSEDQAP